LLEDEEAHSAGILRMLNCGQHVGFDVLLSFVDDTPGTINILNRIIKVDRSAAGVILREEGLTEEQVGTVLDLTHCENLIPQYVITSQDMIGKSGVWGHFGSWDFDRAAMYNKVKKEKSVRGIDILVNEFNLSQAQAQSDYQEIQSGGGDSFVAPWPSYTGSLAGCSRQGLTVQCGNGAIIDTTTLSTVLHVQGQSGTPYSLVYVDGDDVVEKVFPNANIGLSVILIPSESSFTSMLALPPQGTSLFTRFFKGHGMKYFEPFRGTRTFNGQEITVWKVDWDAKDKLVVPNLVQLRSQS
jgi:hypothetical protein